MSLIESLVEVPSTGHDEWATPSWLFNALNREFQFTLDPCSNWDGSNALCDKFFTFRQNGRLQDWGTNTVFMNPPYSDCENWMRKAYGASQDGATVVCLMPAKTDTIWWHEFAMKGEIRLFQGRLCYGDQQNKRAPFPSAVIVFRPAVFKLESWDVARNKFERSVECSTAAEVGHMWAGPAEDDALVVVGAGELRSTAEIAALVACGFALGVAVGMVLAAVLVGAFS